MPIVADDLSPSQPIKLTYLGHEPAIQAANVYAHYRYLVLLNPNADTHLTVPWRVEG